MTENNVRGFPADSGQACQFLHGRWNFAVELFDKLASTSFQRSCFGPKQSQGADDGVDLGQRRIRQPAWSWKPTKKFRGYSIDREVGALRRQNHRNQELKGSSIVERNLQLRIGLGKTARYRIRASNLGLNTFAFSPWPNCAERMTCGRTTYRVGY
jgi:hypothetical protein